MTVQEIKLDELERIKMLIEELHEYKWEFEKDLKVQSLLDELLGEMYCIVGAIEKDLSDLSDNDVKEQ